MVDPLSLRREAALYRKRASVPTSGGWTADRLLIAIAERLEQKAAATERGEKSADNRGLGLIHGAEDSSAPQLNSLLSDLDCR